MLHVSSSSRRRRRRPRRDRPGVLALVGRLCRDRAVVVRRVVTAIAAGAAFAGCAVPPDQATSSAVFDEVRSGSQAGVEPLDPQSTLAHPPTVGDAQCMTGAWVTTPRECACPQAGDEGFTAECQALDCQEVDLLGLLPGNEALLATLRVSVEELQLSAVGGEPLVGTWQLLDDGELRLELDDNLIYTPAECQDGELQLKGHPLLRPPPPALEMAIFWAWLTDEWEAAVYLP